MSHLNGGSNHSQSSSANNCKSRASSNAGSYFDDAPTTSSLEYHLRETEQLLEISLLKKKLRETERAMEKIMADMGVGQTANSASTDTADVTNTTTTAAQVRSLCNLQ